MNLPARRSGAGRLAWLSGGWGAIAVAGAIYLLLYVGWIYFRWGGEANRALVNDLAYLPLSLLAGVLAWRVAFRPGQAPHLRRAWILLGLVSFSQFLGDAVWFYLEIIQHAAPFPSLADFFYLIFYPLALFGLLALSDNPLKPEERWRLTLDMGIVMTAAWMLVWYFVISPAAAEAATDFVSQSLAAIYPIGDLMVIGGALFLLLRGLPSLTRSVLALYLTGIVVYVVGDLFYGYYEVRHVYASGMWVDVTWLIAYWFFALAALRQAAPASSRPAQHWQSRLEDLLGTSLPFIAIGVGFGLVIWAAGGATVPGKQLQGLFASAGILTALVVGRQVLAVRENMRLAEGLRVFSVQLEERVRERTAELQQAQEALSRSEKLAITGTLASEIVHEVSNPLNTIINASESLESDLSESGRLDLETLKIYLPIITRAAWHASEIMQALRKFSRGQGVEMVAQDLGGAVQDALLLMEGQVRRWPNIRLVTEIETGLPPVLCDRNQIAQLVVNLLTNARDAMPDGGAITVRVRPQADPAGVRLEVSDQGIGLAPDMLTKIFEPFFTTKSIGQGSGLGLAIVTRITRAHRGVLRVASDGLGCGATFSATFPAAPSVGAAPV